jgi:prepilin-type N-terminal cleavage/methylation domain-containing protein
MPAAVPPGRSEAGYTLTEVMVASAILLVMMTGAMSLLVAGQRLVDFGNRRGQSQDDLRLAMDRLAKDVRQVARFNTTFTPDSSGSWAGNDLDFQTYTVASPDTPVRVRWWVADATLHRREFRPDGSVAATVAVLSGLAPPGPDVPDLFICDLLHTPGGSGAGPEPWQMTITLTMRLANPDGVLSMRSRVDLRNLHVPQPPARRAAP